MRQQPDNTPIMYTLLNGFQSLTPVINEVTTEQVVINLHSWGQ